MTAYSAPLADMRFVLKHVVGLQSVAQLPGMEPLDEELLDQILELYLEDGCGRDEIVDRGFDPAVVDDIVRRIRINEYKRKQAPMGLKVTSKAFGIGRRLPNVQNYHG